MTIKIKLLDKQNISRETFTKKIMNSRMSLKGSLNSPKPVKVPKSNDQENKTFIEATLPTLSVCMYICLNLSSCLPIMMAPTVKYSQNRP